MCGNSRRWGAGGGVCGDVGLGLDNSAGPKLGMSVGNYWPSSSALILTQTIDLYHKAVLTSDALTTIFRSDLKCPGRDLMLIRDV